MVGELPSKTLFLALALSVVACMSVEHRIFPPGCAAPRRKPEQVAVGYSVPSVRHRFLGELVVQYGAGYSREQVMSRLRQEAAACGADGILLGPLTRVDNVWKWSDRNIRESFDTSGYRLTVTLYRLED